MSHEMRAWAIYVPGWGDKPQGITMATSRSRAIQKSHASANEAGYALKWPDFRAVRAPDFDSMFAKHGAFSWSLSHANAMRATITKEQP